LDQEIGALNREKNAITHPLSQIPGYATIASLREKELSCTFRRDSCFRRTAAHLVLQCYDTVGWVMWPVKRSPKWPIMCRVGH